MPGLTATTDPSIDDVISQTFFPAIDPNQFRRVMRVDDSHSNELTRQVLIESMMKVNIDLKSLTEFDNFLASVPDSLTLNQIDGTDYATKYYLDAIYHCAKSKLLDRFIDYDNTNKVSEDNNELNQINIDSHVREYRLALARLLDKPRFRSEVI